MEILNTSDNKKVYFVSDHHFGSPNNLESITREKHFVKWLSIIEDECHSLFILGDFVDFWMEYKTVIPKGFVRVFGKLAELSDKGINIYYFLGNHDLWIKDYFIEELGFKIFKKETVFKIDDKLFFLAHGDGLGNSSKFYSFIKYIYTNKYLQFLFRSLHPDIGISIAQNISQKRKEKHKNYRIVDGKDILLDYAKTDEIVSKQYDYIIFGHQHNPKEEKITDKTTYFNLGDWITHNSYIVFESQICKLCYYK